MQEKERKEEKRKVENVEREREEERDSGRRCERASFGSLFASLLKP